MTSSQRTVLIGMMDAIIACEAADQAMRERAMNLRTMLDPLSWLMGLAGGYRR